MTGQKCVRLYWHVDASPKVAAVLQKTTLSTSWGLFGPRAVMRYDWGYTIWTGGVDVLCRHEGMQLLTLGWGERKKERKGPQTCFSICILSVGSLRWK